MALFENSPLARRGRLADSEVMTHTTQTPSPIDTPGHILANVPGILGFYPANSVLFITVENTDKGTCLGPLIRVNAEVTEELLDHIATPLQTPNCEAIFAFVIGSYCHHHTEHLIDVLMGLTTEHETIDITAAWITPEISVGAPYSMLFGPFHNQTGEGLMRDWARGTIPNITDSETMRRCIAEGNLPDLDRDEHFSIFFEKNPFLSADEIKSMDREAYEIASDMRMQSPDGPSIGCGVTPYEFIETVPVILDKTRKSVDIRTDSSVLTVIGSWLATTWSRDLIIRELLEEPEVAADALLAAAQTFTGTIRANALCLFAGVSMAGENSKYANPALNTALEEFPEHNLTKLLHESYKAGLIDETVANLKSGSITAQKQVLDDHEDADYWEDDDIEEGIDVWEEEYPDAESFFEHEFADITADAGEEEKKSA